MIDTRAEDPFCFPNPMFGSDQAGKDFHATRFDSEVVIASAKRWPRYFETRAAEISPGEFAHEVRTAVENCNIQTVLIDSLNGYQNAMPDERHLMLHMHELLLYLNGVGAATFLTVAQHGVVSDMRTPVDMS